jgi:putative hydrolase of the HAD superfamily
MINQQQQQLIQPAKTHYKNIVFDLGGVLVNFNPRHVIANIFQNEPRIPWELLEVVSSQEWLDMDRGTIHYDQAVEQLASRYPRESFIKFYDAVHESLTPIHEGVEILRSVQAQGYKTYILSNLGQRSHAKLSTIDNFFGSFDGAIFSYQVKTIKPEPEIYQLLLNTYNLKPEESIFIDDLEVNINSAKQQGIDGIVCSNHTTVHEELRKRGILP